MKKVLKVIGIILLIILVIVFIIYKFILQYPEIKNNPKVGKWYRVSDISSEKFLFCILFNMNIFEIVVSSIGLASDAFAVAISKGLSLNKVKLKNCFTVGIWFGLFQSLMCLFGYIFGGYFNDFMIKVDHYISFGLLVSFASSTIKTPLLHYIKFLTIFQETNNSPPKIPSCEGIFLKVYLIT